MSKFLNRVCNWTFGGLFRALGRFLAIILIILLISFLSSKNIIKIPNLFPIMKVDALVNNQLYSLTNNPTYFTFGAYGEVYGTTTQACYPGVDIDFNGNYRDIIINNPNLANDEGVLNFSGLKGGFDTNDIFQGNGNHLQNVFRRFEFQVNTSTTGAFKKNTYYYLAVQMVSSHKNFWGTEWKYNNGNPNLGDFIYLASNTYLPYTVNNVELYTTIYKDYDEDQQDYSNVAWIIYKFKLPNTFERGIPGFVFDLWLPSTQYVYCTDDAGYWFGEENWLYINDAIVFDSNFSIDDLTFPTEDYDNDFYYLPQGYNKPSSGDEPGYGDIIIDDDIINLPGLLPPGPLDSILNLPITLMQNLSDSLDDSCSSLSITLPFINSSITIPCISVIFSRITGLSTFFDFVGIIVSGLIMYNYLLYLYQWVDDITSLRHTRQRLFGAKSDVDNWGGVE